MTRLCLSEIDFDPGSAPFALAGAEGSFVNLWWWLAFALLMLVLIAIDLLPSIGGRVILPWWSR